MSVSMRLKKMLLPHSFGKQKNQLFDFQEYLKIFKLLSAFGSNSVKYDISKIVLLRFQAND